MVINVTRRDEITYCDDDDDDLLIVTVVLIWIYIASQLLRCVCSYFNTLCFVFV